MRVNMNNTKVTMWRTSDGVADGCQMAMGDCQARKLNKEDAMDRCKWRKMIKEAR